MTSEPTTRQDSLFESRPRQPYDQKSFLGKTDLSFYTEETVSKTPWKHPLCRFNITFSAAT